MAIHLVRQSRFQSTLPRGSDSALVAPAPSLLLFQSTLSRGSDLLNKRDNRGNNISIHAPSRERRLVSRLGRLYGIISIHAPSRERRRSNQFYRHYGDFNPRSLAGATGWFYEYYGFFKFQSTLPRGSDIGLTVSDEIHVISIHAPSRERLRYMRMYALIFNFNPRSLAGATSIRLAAALLSRISIHAPSRERLK